MGAVAGSLTPTPGFVEEHLRKYTVEVAEWIWTQTRVVGRPEPEVYAEADKAMASGRRPEPKSADAPKRSGRPPKVKSEPGERPPLQPSEVEAVG